MMDKETNHKQSLHRVLEIFLWLQLGIILFTIPAGRIAFDMAGIRMSMGGDAYKLFSAFLGTWIVIWFLANRPQTRRGVFLAPLAGLTLAILLSGAASGYLYESVKDALKLGLCTAFYFALINVSVSEKATRWVAGCFVAGNLYLGFVVLFELFVGRQFRAEGTFGHPNLLAAYALLGLPMLLLIVRLCRDWRTYLLVFGVAVLLFVSILLTFSRAAYLGLLVSALLMWRLGGRRALAHLIPLAAVAVLLSPFLAGPASGRFKETLLDISASRPESRLVIWDEMFSYGLHDLPAWGWGSGESLKDRVSYLQSLRTDRPPYPTIKHSHNLLLQTWLTLGVPGVLMLIWFAVRFVRFVPPRAPGGTWGRYGEHAYFFGSIVGFAVFTCFDTLLFSRNVTPALALLLGILERLRGDYMIQSPPAEPAVTAQPHRRVIRPSRSLRILHLFGSDRYTGPADMVLTVCSLLSERGHMIVFASPAGPPRWRISSRGLVITSREMQESRTLRSHAEQRGIIVDEDLHLNRHFNLLHNLADIRRLRGFVRRDEWDVIHAHLPHELALAALAFGLRTDKPALVASCYKDQSPPKDPFSRFVYRRVSGLMCVSTANRESVIQAGLMDEGCCWVLPGMVDTERFHPGLDGVPIRQRLGIPASAPVAGMISRFQPYRRHDLVVDAWAHVVRRIPDARLVLIGRGENEDEIRRLVEKRELSGSVVFAGYQIEEFPEYVAALDLLIYLRPGSDGTCRTVLEAMAVGRPSLVSPIGSLVDLVEDGVTGVIAHDERPESLAESFVEIVSSPDKIREMGRRCRLLVERKHTPNHVADFFEEVYSGAIASKEIPEQDVYAS
ncbi:MAG: glycosyltransferase [bacterium]